MNVDFERLKVICSREDGQGKRVPVSRSHKDKRIGECVCSFSIFNREELLNVRKSCITRK